jgi:CheY-like chemotaxis protein
VELDQSYVQSHLGAVPGQYVRLTVSDTGIGMDEETKSHIFEPFFTTKGRNKGTGLGLSTVYGIVKQNNGYIQVDSAPGQGTTFQIYFPAVIGEENEQPDRTERSYPGKNETILLVEDEAEVRELARKILEGNNYRVLLAKDGQSALRIVEKYRKEIDLILTDVIMPGMSGRDVAREIQKRKPGIRVVYMSGYTDDAILPHGILEENARFIQKPFGSFELLRIIREALDEPAP